MSCPCGLVDAEPGTPTKCYRCWHEWQHPWLWRAIAPQTDTGDSASRRLWMGISER